MLNSFKLLLPALFPSWRFFDTVAPSPRIEFALCEDSSHLSQNWQEFRPRIDNLSFGKILRRMFWNPHWNESLFLVSCAERLMSNPTEHSSNEIVSRIRKSLKNSSVDLTKTPYMKFRLVFLYREDKDVERYIAFTSQDYDLTEAN